MAHLEIRQFLHRYDLTLSYNELQGRHATRFALHYCIGRWLPYLRWALPLVADFVSLNPTKKWSKYMISSDGYHFPVVLTEDEAGFFNATCPVIPGCFSQGRTREEALVNVREAIELALLCREEEGWELPIRYELTDVSVA